MMRFTINISFLRKSFIKKGLFVYLALTIFEAFLNYSEFGSLLKYYSLFLLYTWFLITIKERRRIKLGNVFILLVLWLAIGMLSLIRSSNYDLGQYYLLAIGNMVLIILMVNNIKWDVNDIEWFSLFYKISALVFAILMIRNRELYHGRGIRYTLSLNDSEMDPNNIAGLLIPGALMALHTLLSRHRMRLLILIFNLSSLVLILVAIFMSGSRGGVLGLSTGMIVYLVFWIFKNKKGNVFVRIFFVGLLLLLLAFSILFQVDQTLLKRLMPSTFETGGGSGRLFLWDIALSFWGENPILGIGLGGFSGITGKTVHNTYLLVLVEMGVLGFLCWFSALIYLLIHLWKKKNYFMLSMLLSMMVVIFFLDAYQKKFMWNVLILSVISSEID